ncbi:hypothetical protein ACFL6U_18980 [Planctomycetota bacterium]
MSKKRSLFVLWILGISGVILTHAVKSAEVNDIAIVKDINLVPTSSFPKEIVIVDDRAFFIADDGIHGTIAGTYPLKETIPDLDGLSVQNLTGGGDKVYLVVNDFEIWETDGAASGTLFLGSIYESAIQPPSQFVPVKGSLFFTTTDLEHGCELWKMEGMLTVPNEHQ